VEKKILDDRDKKKVVEILSEVVYSFFEKDLLVNRQNNAKAILDSLKKEEE